MQISRAIYIRNCNYSTIQVLLQIQFYQEKVYQLCMKRMAADVAMSHDNDEIFANTAIEETETAIEDPHTAIDQASRRSASSYHSTIVDPVFGQEETSSIMNTQYSETARTARKAKFGELFDVLRKDVKGMLKNPTANRIFAPLEKHLGLKRKHVVYGSAIAFAIYLLVGASAQIVCNVACLAYPATVSIQNVRSNALVPPNYDNTQVRFSV